MLKTTGHRLARIRDAYGPDWRLRLLLIVVLWTMLAGMAFDIWPVVAVGTVLLIAIAVVALRRR